MSEIKEIELSENDVKRITGLLYEDIWEELKNGNPVTLVPPKRKIVKLADLPDGTIVQRSEGIKYYVSDGQLYEKQSPAGFVNPASARAYQQIRSMKLCEGPKTVLEGGECPLPEGVMIRCRTRIAIHQTSDARNLRWKHVQKNGDIIWYQIIGLVDGYRIEE